MSYTCNKLDCGTYFDLESLIVSLFGKDENGCVGLKVVQLDATDCADLTDLKECGMYLNAKQAIGMSIVDDGCGGNALGVFFLTGDPPR